MINGIEICDMGGVIYCDDNGHVYIPAESSVVLDLGTKATAIGNFGGKDGKKIIVGDGNGNVHFIQVKDGKELTKVKSLKVHHSFITSISYNADGSRFFTTSYDGSIGVWDMETMENLEVKENAHRGTVNCGLWDEKREMLITCGSDVMIKGWSF